MSLAFLAKKSWHTATLKNVEKVWAAEEEEKKEQQKIENWKKVRARPLRPAPAPCPRPARTLPAPCPRPARFLPAPCPHPVRALPAPYPHPARTLSAPFLKCPTAKHGCFSSLQAVEEERQIMELRQLQEETGVVPKRTARVDFLYEDAGASAEATAQAHLLGKPVELVPEESAVKQVRVGRKNAHTRTRTRTHVQTQARTHTRQA